MDSAIIYYEAAFSDSDKVVEKQNICYPYVNALEGNSKIILPAASIPGNWGIVWLIIIAPFVVSPAINPFECACVERVLPLYN